MDDDPTLSFPLDDKSIEAERLATLRQGLIEADEADVIMLTGRSREEWLAQLDRAVRKKTKTAAD